jgi:hypothetical protein
VSNIHTPDVERIGKGIGVHPARASCKQHVHVLTHKHDTIDSNGSQCLLQ